MKPQRFFLSILFITFCFAEASAQQQYAFNIEQAPTLRGLRLGMSIEQARAALPALRVPQLGGEQFGVTYASLDKNTSTETNKAALDGVRYVSLQFFDDHLVLIRLSYDDSVYWESVDQFTARISSSLRLPNAWQQTEQEAWRKLTGNGFYLAASLSGHTGGSLEIGAQTGWEDVVKRRRWENQERKREAFRP